MNKNLKVGLLFIGNAILLLLSSKAFEKLNKYAQVTFDLKYRFYGYFLQSLAILLTGLIIYLIGKELKGKSLLTFTILLGIIFVFINLIYVAPVEILEVSLIYRVYIIFAINTWIIKLIAIYFGYFLIKYLQERKSQSNI
ncbi:hypothetical protein [Anaerosphaera multitolerans]|uniref:Uncharacterized protein n=1 Tax=Anaerosphaera multitolerans TaxID=2487351 RepID=A0A437S487_9FIRM|nr:hypothetical protein [Anaerosphaera multitolerans]RVU53824.1 hypothetical protein EF514_10565 [Anaerosphaera multitolerans]